MNSLAKLVGIAAIAAIALLPFAYIAGSMSLGAYKAVALALTAVWFIAAPLSAAKPAVD